MGTNGKTYFAIVHATMKKVLEHVHLEPIVYRNFGVDLRTLLAISINVDNYNMIRAEACNSERINIQQKNVL